MDNPSERKDSSVHIKQFIYQAYVFFNPVH